MCTIYAHYRRQNINFIRSFKQTSYRIISKIFPIVKHIVKVKIDMSVFYKIKKTEKKNEKDKQT